MKDGFSNESEWCNKLHDPEMIQYPNEGDNATTTTLCQSNIDFYAMQYSLIANAAILGVGGTFFLLAAIWIVQDKARVDKATAAESGCSETSTDEIRSPAA